MCKLAKNKFNLFILILVLIGVGGCATMTGSSGVKIPSYKETRLKNGLTVLSVIDRSLPYVSVGLLVQGGGAEDPATKSGLTSLTADLLERGTKTKSATEIAEQFGLLGSELSIATERDYSILSAASLSADQTELLNLFFQVVTEPAFTSLEIERRRKELLSEIQRAYDQPRYVANRIFSSFLYGAHPYGRPVEGVIRDIKSIKQKDIIRQYLKSFRPNNSILILVGDVQNSTLSSLENKLSNWTSRELVNEPMPTVGSKEPQKILFVSRNDLQQSEIRLGHFGIQRKNDDFLALMVAETVLAGSMNSRLIKEIRVRRGLTYGIQTAFNATKQVGPYIISSNTRHDKVGELIKETLTVVKNFVREGITDEELQDAKGYLLGSFPNKVETPDRLAKIILAYRIYGIADEELTEFVSRLNKLNKEDINKAIQRNYFPDNFQVLVYGPEKIVLPQLREIGAVQTKNYKELL